LKAKLKEARHSSIQEYINKLGRHDSTLWKPVKSARKPKLAIPPIRRQPPTVKDWVKSDKEKADLFGEHLATVFTPHSDDPDPEINRLLASIHNKKHNANILTLQDVQNRINHSISRNLQDQTKKKKKCLKNCHERV
jgi:hypothetical protein